MATSKRLKLALLMGGASSEHDVSVFSGLRVLKVLDPARYEVTPVLIERDGSWCFGSIPEALSLEVEAGAIDDRVAVQVGVDQSGVSLRASRGEQSVKPTGESGALERLSSGLFDVAFIALHGLGGEDGTVQGLLSLAGLPFTGSGLLASALAMDKVVAKHFYRIRSLPVAEDLVLLSTDPVEGNLACRIEEKCGFPCVAKPATGGSSFGTCIVSVPEEIDAAVVGALEESDRVLFERLIVGTELTCGVLGGGVLEPTLPLPVTEIVPMGSAFFDFRAKYTTSACEEVTPARIPDAIARLVQQIAREAHDVLGCEGMSRSDFMLDGSEPILLETNTIPGMTATSLLPQGAAAAGISFPQLIDRLVRSALLRAGDARADDLEGI